jgi:hypothetical protein
LPNGGSSDHGSEAGEVIEPSDDVELPPGDVDTRGFYSDGAYTAYPDLSSEGPDAEERQALADPEGEAARAEAYYASLMMRFSELRAQLHAEPDDDVLASLSLMKHPTEVGPFGPNSRTFGTWRNFLRTTEPHPTQIAAMDKTSVLRILRVLHRAKFLRSGTELKERTSRWLWSLLARLPDRGEMTSDEIGVVRELGKRAVAIAVGLVEKEVSLDGSDGEQESSDEDGNAGEEREYRNTSSEDNSDDEDQQQQLRDTASELGLGDKERTVATPQLAGAPGNSTREGLKVEADNVEGEDIGGELRMPDLDEGEIADEAEEVKPAEDISAAKYRLLSQLNGSARLDGTQGEQAGVVEEDQAEAEAGLPEHDQVRRAQENLHVTLNMILTVAGEFYGQRDLLEFREPFEIA